jgi:hypothetical protein
MEILYSLGHLGFTVPPQADAGLIGEAGPGPSYLDDGSGGPDNDFTNRNTTFMTWNLLHLGADAEERRRRARAREPAHGVGRGLPVRLPEPRAPLKARRRIRRTDDGGRDEERGVSLCGNRGSATGRSRQHRALLLGRRRRHAVVGCPRS